MMTRIFSLLAVLMVLSISAWAMDLSAAKELGLVGERPNGLIGAVAEAPSADVLDLVKSVNEGRRKIYAQNAAEQKISADQVGAIADPHLQL